MYRLKEFTLQEVVAKSTRHYALRKSLCTIRGVSFTYYETGLRIQAIQAFLAANGIKKGDRVALIAENRPEWGHVYLAVTSMGAIIVPILTDFLPAQIATILQHADCSLIFTSEKALEKLSAYTTDKPVLRVENCTAFSGTLNVAYDAHARFIPFPVAKEDVASILYTSGTTGHSKGVMLTHEGITKDARGSHECVLLHRTDRLLSILPLAHTYECTLGFVGPFMQGCSIYYLDKPPAPSVLLPALKAVKPTIIMSVPLVIEKIVRQSIMPKLKAMKALSIPVVGSILYRIAGKKLIGALGGHLRWFGIGGAALNKEIEAVLLKMKFPFSVGYGLTESSPLISGNPPSKTRAGCCGKAFSGIEVRIYDPNPQTGEGEIQVKGPIVMKGYFKDPEKTKEVMTEDGYLKTGDLGVIAKDGFISIRGRIKTMILGPSGENIYPEEIETVINSMEAVQESLVYADDEGVITALVQVKPEFLENLRGDLGDKADYVGDKAQDILEAIRKEVNSRLAGFSRVKKIVLHEEAFEKTPTLKIKRYKYPLKKDDKKDKEETTKE